MDYLSLAWSTLLILVVIRLLVSMVRKGEESSTRKLPPGPRGLPIFGNLFSLGTKPHITMAELAKTYGPLMLVQLGQVPTVIISSPAIAKEVLQTDDALFSNRMVIDAMRARDHHESSIIFSQVSQKWRNLRKICNSLIFSPSRLDASQSLRRNKVSDLLSQIKRSSEVGEAVEVGQAAFTTSLNLLSNTFFSVDLGEPNFAHEFKMTVRGVMEEAAKHNSADFFPALRKIDPQGIRQRISVHFQKIDELTTTMINKRLQGHISGNSTLDALLGLNQEKAEEKFEVSKLLGELFVAGTDTTSSTLDWAMAELLRAPEILNKGKAELHEVLGRGNPLNESDISRLPYLQAIIKETLRLHPVAPFLVPRQVHTDIELCGFTVPKHAQVLVNVWAIGRDPDVWHNPNKFEPERFLNSEIDVKAHHFELIPFGSGRRICPGLPLALRMLHLMLGSLIHDYAWKLEGEISPENLDMEETFGFTLEKAERLRIIPVRV